MNNDKPKEKLRTVQLENLGVELIDKDRKLLKPLTVTCTDCHKQFIITPEEQSFFKQKQFALPKRCKPCRVIRRQNNLSVPGR
jgi:hypothetical protein